VLRRLEGQGLVRQSRDGYRLTRRGVSELALGRALARAVVRGF
jgi:DNA-binding MarR family transcriptional regulator